MLGQVYGEGCVVVVVFVGGSDCVIMQFDQLLYDCKVQVQVVMVMGGGVVGLVEVVEQMIEEFGCDVIIVVMYGDFLVVVVGLQLQVDVVFSWGEFDGVGQQVLEYLLQVCGVVQYQVGLCGQLQVYVQCFVFGYQFLCVDCFIQYCVQVQYFYFQLYFVQQYVVEVEYV